MSKLAKYAATWLASYALYLVLTGGSGGMVTWSTQELIAGAIVALLVSLIATPIFIRGDLRMLNPKRWVLFLAYAFGPFFLAMAKANIDVAYRVITGKIRPGIVKVKPNLKHNFAKTLLANSITLTPGTFTIDIDDEGNFYIHWLYVPEGKERPKPKDVYGVFEDWARRVAD
ncbi:MAG: Na+/H+ antiporter subunit E [Euryarchaeota archaeon]|nr:Na+/H+ antiporter subunit E [Euryarchaeota archaeon]